MRKIIVLIFTIFVIGCLSEKTVVSEPTSEELRNAFKIAIEQLNQKTESKIENVSFDWMEVPHECYDELDYYAQQFLWAYIYQEEAIKKRTFLIDCNVPKQYRNI